jgi:hypothetical protein
MSARRLAIAGVITFCGCAAWVALAMHAGISAAFDVPVGIAIGYGAATATRRIR